DSRRNIMLTVLKDECKKMNLEYIKDEGNNSEILEKIVELTFVNKGKASVIAMQDLLGIGKEGRMNFPSTLSTLNWSWRMKKEDFLNKKEKISALLTKCVDEVEKM
ncbi:MAG: 4-alpha-glucanotransferase, partial [Mollicutes bacterium]|nr:4-alpha-glucanotransferase [Mollicutes bacterium]